MERKRDVESIRPLTDLILQKLPELKVIWIFGSFGTDYQNSESDIDLAVYAGRALDGVQLWQLCQELAVAANRDVQIVDLWKASTVFRYQVISEGDLLYTSDSTLCALLETTWTSRYLFLQDERAGIIEDFMKEGTQ